MLKWQHGRGEQNLALEHTYPAPPLKGVGILADLPNLVKCQFLLEVRCDNFLIVQHLLLCHEYTECS